MRIHHIALRTRDLARLEAFYAGLLGLPAVRRAPERSVWLDAEGAVVMLERADAEELTLPPGTKETLAFAVAPGERAALVQRLAGAGVAVESETDFTTYVRDPDGRRVAVSHYPEPRSR